MGFGKREVRLREECPGNGSSDEGRKCHFRSPERNREAGRESDLMGLDWRTMAAALVLYIIKLALTRGGFLYLLC